MLPWVPAFAGTSGRYRFNSAATCFRAAPASGGLDLCPPDGHMVPLDGAMNHDSYPDSYIRGILNTVKTIAMVGASAKDNRPSYFAFKYLLERGYRMIPVNPGLAGKDLLGQRIYARLSEIPEPIDMVDVFPPAPYPLP